MSLATRTRSPARHDLAKAPPARRVLVLYERRESATAALREAVELTATAGELTVVTLAPQAAPSRCCGPGPGVYNCAVRDEAALELREASEILGPAAARTTFKMLIERRDRPLASCDHRSGDLIVKLPTERVEAMVAAGVGEPFAPAGRVFRQWVLVVDRDADRWSALIAEARQFAQGEE